MKQLVSKIGQDLGCARCVSPMSPHWPARGVTIEKGSSEPRRSFCLVPLGTVACMLAMVVWTRITGWKSNTLWTPDGGF